jgi:hypothetical protein
MMKSVMAVAQIDNQNAPHILCRDGARKLVVITDQIWLQNATLIATQTAAK